MTSDNARREYPPLRPAKVRVVSVAMGAVDFKPRLGCAYQMNDHSIALYLAGTSVLSFEFLGLTRHNYSLGSLTFV